MATETQIKARLGKRLAAVRKENGLTQEQLAHKAGLDRDTIAFIETGIRFPTANTLSLLLNALNVGLEDLFTGI